MANARKQRYPARSAPSWRIPRRILQEAPTAAFEQSLLNVLDSSKAIILCEGETDPAYFRAAAELLDFGSLLEIADFDWIGSKSPKGAVDGGKTNLDSALKFLRNNPQFLKSKTVLLYDADTKKTPEDIGKLFVRSLSQNPTNDQITSGIENLLPNAVFDDQFFDEKIDTKRGREKLSRVVLNKPKLCEHLCEISREREHFLNFEPVLAEIRRILQQPPLPSPE